MPNGFVNDVMFAMNGDFSSANNNDPLEANGLFTDGDVWIGSTAVNAGGTHVNVGQIQGAGTVSVSYSSPNLIITGTGGSGIVTSITGGPGITITGTAAVPIVNSVIFTDTAAATLAVDNGYNATAAGTYNMPATAAQGELIIVFCDTAGAVVLDCPALNFIRIGNQITSAGGTATSTAQGDSLTLRYRLSSLTWEATSSMGNWTIA